MPHIFLYQISQAYAVYALSQKVPKYTRNAMVAGAVFHLMFVCIFCYYFEMGFTGVCWATGCMFVARFLVTVLQV